MLNPITTKALLFGLFFAAAPLAGGCAVHPYTPVSHTVVAQPAPQAVYAAPAPVYYSSPQPVYYSSPRPVVVHTPAYRPPARRVYRPAPRRVVVRHRPPHVRGHVRIRVGR